MEKKEENKKKYIEATKPRVMIKSIGFIRKLCDKCRLKVHIASMEELRKTRNRPGNMKDDCMKRALNNLCPSCKIKYKRLEDDLR